MKPLRQGRFKKILAPPEQLITEAPQLSSRMTPLWEALEKDTLTPAEFVALWSLQYLRVRSPDNWWGAKLSAPLAPHALGLRLSELAHLGFTWTATELALADKHQTLGSLWAERAFKATPEAVHRSILSWSTGAYSLMLMDRVPTVEEVLEQQIHGQRCVTVPRSQNTLAKLILGERDALGFAFHDLIHADHFFRDRSLMLMQIGFYRQVETLMGQGALSPFMAHASFPEDLDYLVADMNSHPVHLWKCFEFACREAHPEEAWQLFSQDLVRRLDLSLAEAQALGRLNSPEFVLPADGETIEKLCQRFGGA